jgi:hypothetical protein
VLSASGVPLGAGGAGAVILVHDVTAHRQAEEAVRSQMMTRPFVRRLVLNLAGRLRVPPAAIAEVGRSLAAEAEQHGVEEFAAAFRSMGLGNLEFERREGENYIFHADDLLERRTRASQPTCHLALGYVQGAVTAIHGGLALGSELRCQSQGHPKCVFVVAPRKAVAPPKGRARAAEPPAPMTQP